jgi:hypothetical protein
MIAAKRTLVSRSADTAAMGARVIAQSTIPYAATLQNPPEQAAPPLPRDVRHRGRAAPQ